MSSKTVAALKKGEIIDFEGIMLKMADGDIKTGDLYIGERNQGPKLLTAEKIVPSECGCHGYIIPTGFDSYVYDFPAECVKVQEA